MEIRRTDQDFMEMALALAEKGTGFTAPNPMVGAVVVKDGKAVGQGYHQKAGGPHAEVHAIDDAGARAEGATLYVTLEPCNHTGRTPPCTEKIRTAGIRRVVIATTDPNPRVTGRGADCLEQSGITVTTGVCAGRAARLNEFFFKYITTNRPFVVAKCAATLDGRIAARTGDSKWVTGELARAHVHRLRHAVDAIMVGIGTVAQDNPSLTTRIPEMAAQDPVRIVLDSRLRISETARLLHLDSQADTLIICSDMVPMDKRRHLETKSVKVVPCPAKLDGHLDLDELMRFLGGMGISSLLIEGGGRVLASAFRDRIVDKCAFFYAPKILGGDDGVPICSGPGPDLMADCKTLRDVEIRRFGEDILIEGYVVSSNS